MGTFATLGRSRSLDLRRTGGRHRRLAEPWKGRTIVLGAEKGIIGLAPTLIVAESVQIVLIAASISLPGRHFGERHRTRVGVQPLL